MENKEISLSEAMRFMVDEDKVIVAKAECTINGFNRISAEFVARRVHSFRTWEVMFNDGTFQFRCPGDDEWLSSFHFDDEYKYYLQEEKKEKKKYWLWVNSSSGHVSTLYRDERGSAPDSDYGVDDFSGWIKLPWSEIEL